MYIFRLIHYNDTWAFCLSLLPVYVYLNHCWLEFSNAMISYTYSGVSKSVARSKLIAIVQSSFLDSARTSTLHQHSLGLTKTRHQSGKSLRNPIAKMFLPRSSVPRSNRVKPSEVRSTPSTLISDKPAVCFGTLAFFALLAAFERTTTMKSCLCTLVRSRGY